MAKMWKLSKDGIFPLHGRDVLVMLYNGELKTYCFLPKKEGYFWGWYPGGLPVENSIAWREMDDLKKEFKKENHVIPNRKLQKPPRR